MTVGSMKRWRYTARSEGVEAPPGATAEWSTPSMVEPAPTSESKPTVPVQILVSHFVELRLDGS
jgi:hypothetical protein